ncbi:DUF2789 domain-containing protein [Pseudomonas sp. zfem003]|uniref:DUF2789 domain-containing protein n=1 Tax=Pseudomonas sp. zfem003 TaxID=3078198 RepID=UPI002929C526|nr:DUF2789 domain-containing protein [Pseudomonas sp. zfem003]MDU9395547.1 DUF2789 domain-containing protein [Pseudomonas sp. zfem003]
MDTTPHTLATLFEQLGLDASRPAIEAFIAGHRLEESRKIHEAPFWNEAQRDFLRSALGQDADWAVKVDELAVRLSA